LRRTVGLSSLLALLAALALLIRRIGRTRPALVLALALTPTLGLGLTLDLPLLVGILRLLPWLRLAAGALAFSTRLLGPALARLPGIWLALATGPGLLGLVL
jgi:hypothetical protein